MFCITANNLIIILFDYNAFGIDYVNINIKCQSKIYYAYVFLDKLSQFRLSVNVKSCLSSLQRHCLQKSKYANTVIRMHMCYENFHFSIHTKARLYEISLHTLTNIK